VDRLISPNGLIGLAGRQHPVGYHFAGRRVTVHLDHALLQLVDQGVRLRSLPNPLTPAEQARLHDARPAGPPPQSAPEPICVQRRADSRGALVVAGQKDHIGARHAGQTLNIEEADTTWRIYDGGLLLAEVPARFKVRKPEPHRRTATAVPRADC
jgi:hypothetical protein